MRIKLNKEIEFLFKKLIPDKYLLKKRLIRAIKNNYEEELSLLDKIVNKDLESIDVGVYRGVYSYKLSKISKHVHSIEPNPLIFPYDCFLLHNEVQIKESHQLYYSLLLKPIPLQLP